MRTRAVALAFLACLLSSVGGRKVKANAVNDAGAGTTSQIHSLVEMEQSGTGQVNEAAVGASDQIDSLSQTGQSNNAIDGTSDQTASLAESEQSIAKKPIHSAALLLLALDPAAASFSSPTLLGRFGSLVKEHKDGLRNAALMPKMQYDGGYGGRSGGYGTRGGMYGSTYDDEMRGDMVPRRPTLGFGGSTQDMIDDNTVQRGDDYGYGGSGRMYGPSRRGYGNMYGRRGYGSMYGGGYGYGGSGRYGRYDDSGYGGYSNSGYGNMYGQRGYGSMYGDRYGSYDNDRYGMRGYGYGGSGRYGRYDDSGYGGYGSNYGRSRGGYGTMNDDMYRRGYGNM